MQDVDVLFPFLSAFADFGKALDNLSGATQVIEGDGSPATLMVFWGPIL